MDDLDDDETELILNWRQLTDGQREELRRQIEKQYITPTGCLSACPN